MSEHYLPTIGLVVAVIAAAPASGTAWGQEGQTPPAPPDNTPQQGRPRKVVIH